MTIILICVFGVNVWSAGTVKQAKVSVNRAYYEVLKHEAGDDEILKLCKKHFHKKADLGWMQDT